MPKDTTAAAAIPKSQPASLLAQILAEKKGRHGRAPIALGSLPPLSIADEINRSPRTQPIPDLNSFARLWLLIGEGNTGKTVLARWLIEGLIEHDKFEHAMVAALAPGNRNLVNFAPGTMQPPTADPRATANWASEYLAALQKARWGGVWDFGGGDTALRTLIEAQPDLAERSEQEGLAIVAAYLFSPRLDDLVFLKAFDSTGFRPRATALMLNPGRGRSVGVRCHPRATGIQVSAGTWRRRNLDASLAAAHRPGNRASPFDVHPCAGRPRAGWPDHSRDIPVRA
jgi:hypothetical protein